MVELAEDDKGALAEEGGADVVAGSLDGVSGVTALVLVAVASEEAAMRARRVDVDTDCPSTHCRPDGTYP